MSDTTFRAGGATNSRDRRQTGKKQMKFRILFQTVGAAFVLIAFVVPTFMQQRPSVIRPPHQEKLLNGLKVAMWSVSSAPKVTLKVRIRAGAAFDPHGREGMMVLLSEMFFPSPESRQYFSEDLGGSFELTATYDYIEIAASSDPVNFLTMIESVAAAVTSPNFEKDTIESVKARIAVRRAELKGNTDRVVDAAAAARLFGEFPYGRPLLGTDESMAVIDFVDLRSQYTRIGGADNASLTLYGNFKSDLAFRAIRRYFGSWSKADAGIPYTFKQADPPAEGVLHIDSPGAGKIETRFAVRGFARGGRDFIASEILSAILEERLRANASAEQRDKMFVRNEAYVLPGAVFFGISGLTNGLRRSGNVDSKSDAAAIVRTALAERITPDEFQRAKAKIETKLSNVDVDSLWLDAETYQLASLDADKKALSGVTVADVQNALDKIASEPMVSVLADKPTEN